MINKELIHECISYQKCLLLDPEVDLHFVGGGLGLRDQDPSRLWPEIGDRGQFHQQIMANTGRRRRRGDQGKTRSCHSLAGDGIPCQDPDNTRHADNPGSVLMKRFSGLVIGLFSNENSINEN